VAQGRDFGVGLRRNFGRLRGKTDGKLSDREIEERIQEDAAWRQFHQAALQGNIELPADSHITMDAGQLAKAGQPVRAGAVESLSSAGNPAMVAMGPVAEALGPVASRLVTAPVLRTAGRVVSTVGKGSGATALKGTKGILQGTLQGAVLSAPLLAAAQNAEQAASVVGGGAGLGAVGGAAEGLPSRKSYSYPSGPGGEPTGERNPSNYTYPERSPSLIGKDGARSAEPGPESTPGSGDAAAGPQGEAAIQGVRRNGTPFTVTDMRTWKPWLDAHKVSISLDSAEVKRTNPDGFGKFVYTKSDPASRIVLMDDPTRYEALHEFAHAIHRASMTPEEFSKIEPPAAEQWVYNWLRNTPGVWDSLSAQEQEHAMGYVHEKGGTAFGFLPKKEGN
jgi:hypothetical protein